jgi:hypothetical protein
VLCKVEDVLISNQRFSATKIALNVDDSIVFSTTGNTSVYDSKDCLGGKETFMTSQSTLLQSYPVAGEFYVSTSTCDTLLVVVQEYPKNPYLLKESLLLQQYETLMLQAKLAKSSAILKSFCPWFLVLLMAL